MPKCECCRKTEKSNWMAYININNKKDAFLFKNIIKDKEQD